MGIKRPDRVASKGKIGAIISMIAIVFLFFPGFAHALEVTMEENTDVCIFDPVKIKDYCRTEYKFCDSIPINPDRFNFVFKDDNDKEYKTELSGLETEFKFEEENTNCYKLEITGYKDVMDNIDNVPCIDDICFYEFAWWNSSYPFKTNISFWVTSGSTPQDYQTMITINSTNAPAYWNWSNECVNNYQSRMTILNGSENEILPYFVDEHRTNCSQQYMTFFIPSDQNVTTTPHLIYVYHGNQNIAPYNNGTGTFLQGADSGFETDDWTSDGILASVDTVERRAEVFDNSITEIGYVYKDMGITNILNFTAEFVINLSAKDGSQSSGLGVSDTFSAQGDNWNDGANFDLYVTGPGVEYLLLRKHVGGVDTTHTTAYTWSNNYQYCTVTRNGSIYMQCWTEPFKSGKPNATVSTTEFGGTIRYFWCISDFDDAQKGDAIVDSCLLRKYNPIEPRYAIGETINFTAVPPNITIVNPSPKNQVILVNYAYINATTDIASTCQLEWEGINESMNHIGNLLHYVNKTGLSNGNYTYKAHCLESTGNRGNESREYWVYVSAPVPTVAPAPNVTFTLEVTRDLPVKTTYCVINNFTVIRERQSCFAGQCQTINQTDVTQCTYGCSNNSMSAFGNPGCIESDLLISVIFIAIVVVIVIGIRMVT